MMKMDMEQSEIQSFFEKQCFGKRKAGIVAKVLATIPILVL